MSSGRVGLGRRGEELAARALVREGYTLVARNWRCAEGEVDIVARDGEEWVFVEVRTRRGRAFGTPEESLTPAKQERMIAVAQRYLLEQEVGQVVWRLDLVAIELDYAGRLVRLEQLENVVEGV
jgi:putative endonuclease